LEGSKAKILARDAYTATHTGVALVGPKARRPKQPRCGTKFREQQRRSFLFFGDEDNLQAVSKQ